MDALSELWSPLVPWARALVSHGRGVTVTSAYRSLARQAELYDRWTQLRRAGLSSEEIGKRYGLWTPAPPGRSLHNYGLAFDLGGPLEELEWLGRVWQSWGGVWGGGSDPVHFQVKL